MNTSELVMIPAVIVSSPVKGGFQESYVDMVLSAGPVAKLVLIILLLFSVTSWAIIFFKLVEFSAVRRDTKRFFDVFRRTNNLSSIYTNANALMGSPAAMVFIAAYKEMVEIVEGGPHDEEATLGTTAKVHLSGKELNEIQRVIQNAVSQEISKLEQKISFLATTGSTSPFIGLFGTVWGVMDAFRAIGIKGVASIGGVAPGISEALIATAAGLFAAVPAVVAFNYFNSQVRHFAGSLEEFSLLFTNLLERKLGK